MASLVLTVQVAGLVYRIAGVADIDEYAGVPLLAAATAYFLMNTMSVALAVALSSGQPVIQTWYQNFFWSAPSYFVGAALASLAVTIYLRSLYWLVPVVAVPLLLTYHTYKLYLGRMEDKQRHLQEVSDLHEKTVQALDAVQDSETRLRAVIESINEGMFVVDRDSRITLWNDAAERLLGHARQDVIGKLLIQVLPAIAQTELPAALDAAMKSEQSRALTAKVITGGGAERVFEARVFPFAGGATSFLWDVTDRVHVQEALEKAALHDALTGLPNRSFFMELLGRAVARSKRRREYLFGVMFVDIDRFKIVNDSLGHLMGDRLLVAVAERLQSCLRNGDVIARLGGDEFTIFLDDLSKTDDASMVARRIEAALATPFLIGTRDVYVTVSIGIALSSTGYSRPEELLRDADTAMYKAKALGKARHEIFDVTMHARVVAHLTMETDLRRALQRREFRLYYQPIHALDDGRVIGFEALVRWLGPNGRVVPPGEFIPLAEETGMIVPLGTWVLREACRQTAEWQTRFPSDPPICITVNVSTRQLMQSNFADVVGSAIAEFGVAPGSLRLEITESALIENTETTAKTLLELKTRVPVQLYLDDFGTGYSSLEYLHRLPIDMLKIDRTFISGMATDDQNAAIVGTIFALARQLGIGVVAEGVETTDQLRRLKVLRCEQAQGYLFAQPQPADRAVQLLEVTMQRRMGPAQVAGRMPSAPMTSATE
jgi:diguanylate cyclase (GGDEF)-like protein/PAS domain S-box-containing protein